MLTITVDLETFFDAVTTLLLRLDSSAATAPAPGLYKLTARLELADGRGWRGVVESEAIEIEVVAAAANAETGESLGRRQLFRVRDALLQAAALFELADYSEARVDRAFYHAFARAASDVSDSVEEII